MHATKLPVELVAKVWPQYRALICGGKTGNLQKAWTAVEPARHAAVQVL